jgi:hypothetical protein
MQDDPSLIGAPLVLLDTIAALSASDAGAVVVTGSPAGAVSARYALRVPVLGLVLNDAGVGKDRAGIAGLDLLDASGIPAAAVSHQSARIGDAEDTFKSGVVSHANREAARRGVAAGQSTGEAVRRLAAGPATC